MEFYIVQLDLDSAFDRVSHIGLLFKLKSSGEGGSVLSIRSEFLSNRRQRFVVGVATSEWIPIVSGVPQDVCLDLFCSSSSLHRLTGTWLGFRSIVITSWCMILNHSKTRGLVVRRSRTVKPPHVNVVLSGVYICASPNLDILAVKFDSRLTSYEDHVHDIVSRVSQKNSYFEVF